ncbi:hypothetical protein HMPREF1544_04988 [Mucor circinelloides 1006PhL]|uniref:E3 ubiquitin protein ligase n=1 Tax=Mucor circinelloides f. circinelloides (strain 1006PhL) TaxID=1220926 RepID=S2JCZ6_MUCC1|nr:hypothetical protein HMPREF1544_04988 [Mucor circinelloides 1006PhL]
MGTPEKRRRLEEDMGEASVATPPPSRPPLKKRFTGTFQVPQAAPSTSSTVVKEPSPVVAQQRAPSPPIIVSENLEDYTKDELMQNMRLTKDRVAQKEKMYESVKDKYLSKETRQGLFRIDWGLIQAEIVFMAKILIGVELPEPSELPHRNLSVDQQKEWCYRNQLALKEIGTKTLTRLESWSQQADLIQRKYRLEDDIMLQKVIVSDWLKTEIQDLHASYKRGQQVMIELQKSLDSLLEQINLVKGNVKMATTEVKSAAERLDDCVQELALACKRQDRNKSQLVAALSFGGLGDLAERSTDAETTVKEETKQVQPKKEGIEDSMSASMNEQAIKTQFEEHKLILAARDKEFDNLKRDRQLLLRDEERLLSMFTMGEDRLLETEYAKTLKLSIEHYRDRCYHLEQRRIDIEREMGKISASRQQLVEQVKSEKMAQGITMEAEMRRLEGDLSRIRGQRDHFQLLVEEQKIKEGRERESQEKIISFANQGKLRIASLETRINKLKAEQEMAGPFAKEANTFNELKSNLSHLKIMLSSLEMIERRTMPMHLSSVSVLEDQLNKWNSNALIEAYDAVLSESQKSSLMIEFLEENESHLLKEIDRDINSILEEQQGKKEFDLSLKREQALKLQAEKSKYAQTFASLIAAKEKQIATVSTLRMTKEKQQELIRQLEEKEKALEAQVNDKENEIRKLYKTIEEDKTDLEDIGHLCEDYRISIDQNEIMLAELQKTLKEKTRLLDEEKRLKEQTEENYEKTKKKWDKISQGDNPAEQQLIDECEELRALLKCSTCRQRFRTHILTRCMHTFCKNCIDARLETRQRRCPTCSEPFGANDVKNFYL